MLLAETVGIAEEDTMSAPSTEKYTPSDEIIRSAASANALLVDEALVRDTEQALKARPFTTKPLFHIPSPPAAVHGFPKRPVDKLVCMVLHLPPHGEFVECARRGVMHSCARRSISRALHTCDNAMHSHTRCHFRSFSVSLL